MREDKGGKFFGCEKEKKKKEIIRILSFCIFFFSFLKILLSDTKLSRAVIYCVCVHSRLKKSRLKTFEVVRRRENRHTRKMTIYSRKKRISTQQF